MGDNIYYQGKKLKESLFHNTSEEQSADLKGKYVLISHHFWFFGRYSIEVPCEVKPNILEGSMYYRAKTIGAKARKFLEWLFENHPKLGIYEPP